MSIRRDAGDVGHSNMHYMLIHTKLSVNMHITRNRTPQNRCIYCALKITWIWVNQLMISRKIYLKMPLTGFITSLHVHVWFLNLPNVLLATSTVDVLFIYKPRHDKTNEVNVRPAKTQISLGIRPVWSESSLCAYWVANDPSFLHADSEDSDQTGRMPRLIWVRWTHTNFVGFVMSRLNYALFC